MSNNVLPAQPKVLAVWPTHGDIASYQSMDARQLYDSGLDYTALRDADATRAGLVRQLRRNNYNVLQVMTHGQNGEILLTDGVVEPGWWERLLEGQNIWLAVLMACESASPAHHNAADAMLRSGVPYVVAVDRRILAMDATNFVAMLYSLLADGASIEEAVEQAKLVVPRESAEMIRLHAGEKNGKALVT